MSEKILFVAQIARIQTMTDGSLRVTLDLPESAIMPVAQLMECKRAGAILEVTAEPRIEQKSEQNNYGL